MLNEKNAIELAINKLNENAYEFLENSAKAKYISKKFPIGKENKGWLITFDFKVKTMDPASFFVYVSDPDEQIYIPDIL